MKLSPIVHTRITDYLHQYAQQTPDSEAIVFGKKRISYQMLKDQVETCAQALLAMGVKKGDRIAMLSTPRPEYWVLFLATAGIGAIWLGVNPKYTLDECRYVIGDAQPKLLFALAAFEGRDFSSTVCALLEENDCLEKAIATIDPIPGTLSFQLFLDGAKEIPSSAVRLATEAIERLDPALLVYTSGSSGKPKGALLSHYGLCFGATTQNQHFQVQTPKLICSFPINHVASVADTCSVALVAGGTIYLQERFDPEVVLDTIGRERITVMSGVPTMLMMVLAHPNFGRTDFSSVELILWGGAAMPEAVIKRLQTIAPRLMNLYGLTETAAHTTYASHNATLEELRDSIGRPSPNMSCRIINAEGKPCAIGEQGELQFKGEYLFLGYYNRPEATRDAFTDDSWFHTGDLGYWREDGTITLVGRLSEMFKSGGYNVYPREIELLLESHPDVEMAAVVGVPDPLYQEVGAAYIIPCLDNADGHCGTDTPAHMIAEQLQTFCKDKLANYKVPKYFVISDDLPMLPVGKIDKVTLKKRHFKTESIDNAP